jgi:hypothetical protein
MKEPSVSSCPVCKHVKCSACHRILTNSPIGGAYDAMDIDRGDTLFYSGSDSHDNTDHIHPKVSDKTQALQTSYKLGKSIRVIRSFRCPWSGAPRAGYRYDGLYTIRDETVRHNSKNGAYLRFKLERNSDQPPIDLSRPTAREVADSERVSLGY